MRCLMPIRYWILSALASAVAAAIGFSQTLPSYVPATVHPVGGQPNASAPSSNCADLEYQIELAWRSDPATFPYYLDAVCKGGELELRGNVPNEFVRSRAIEIARSHARIAVRDSLSIYGRALQPTPPLRPYAFRQSVSDALQRLIPQTGSGLHVYCGNDGRVTVSGPAQSWRQKWSISEALRRVPGCTSIDNKMTLTVNPTPIPVVVQTPATNPTPIRKPQPMPIRVPRPAPIAKQVQPTPIPVTIVEDPIVVPNAPAPNAKPKVKQMAMQIVVPEPVQAKKQIKAQPKPKVKQPAAAKPKKLKLPDPPVLAESDGPALPEKPVAKQQPTRVDYTPEKLEQIARAMASTVKSIDEVVAVVHRWTTPRKRPAPKMVMPKMPTAKEYPQPAPKPFVAHKTAAPSQKVAGKPATKYPQAHKKPIENEAAPKITEAPSQKVAGNLAAKYLRAAKKPIDNEVAPNIGIADPIFVAEKSMPKKAAKPKPPAVLPPLPVLRNEQVTKRIAPQPKPVRAIPTIQSPTVKKRTPTITNRKPNSKIYNSAVGTYNPLYVSPNVKLASHQTVSQSPKQAVSPTPNKTVQTTGKSVGATLPPTYREVYLTKRIEAATNVRNAELRFLEPRKLQIRFAVKSRAEGTELAGRIRNMPELRQYHLHFKLQIQQ